MKRISDTFLVAFGRKDDQVQMWECLWYIR